MNKYLTPTVTLDSDSPLIREKVEELTWGVEEPVEKAKKLFYFVRDEIKYDMFVDVLGFDEYRASNTLNRGRGFCVQKAVLLCTLGRAAGIPSRLHFVDIINHRAPEYVTESLGVDHFPYHAYVEFYLNNSWVKATPTFDQVICDQHDLFPVEFDGVHHALLPEQDRKGRPHIEYIKDHGEFADLPYQQIIDTFNRVYGEGAIERWQEACREE